MSETMETFNSLLQLAVENGASDIHVKSNKAAVLRLNGRLEGVEMDALKPEQILEFIESSVPAQFYENWKNDCQIDYSYDLSESGLGRFRVNGFYQRGLPGVVFRHVKDQPPTFGELNHDAEVFRKLSLLKDGIVLVCGATGSGKSSTLAATLEYINGHYDRHIITLEDPIEFNYTDKRSVVNQREIGIDAPSFELGLRAALRQDPDIILIGEMRDTNTFDTALHAAETGHLVFGTLHAANAQQAVQRLFEFFPVEQQHSMRRQIGGALRAIITQKLLPSMVGGRVPATEVLIVDSVTRKIIEEGEFQKIPQVIDSGGDSGSKSFNADLYRLIRAGLISKQDGLAFSPNSSALEMNLKGIFLSTGGLVG